MFPEPFFFSLFHVCSHSIVSHIFFYSLKTYYESVQLFFFIVVVAVDLCLSSSITVSSVFVNIGRKCVSSWQHATMIEYGWKRQQRKEEAEEKTTTTAKTIKSHDIYKCWIIVSIRICQAEKYISKLPYTFIKFLRGFRVNLIFNQQQKSAHYSDESWDELVVFVFTLSPFLALSPFLCMKSTCKTVVLIIRYRSVLFFLSLKASLF